MHDRLSRVAFIVDLLFEFVDQLQQPQSKDYIDIFKVHHGFSYIETP